MTTPAWTAEPKRTPAHVERMESACLRGDQAALESALADLLAEATGRAG